VTPEDPSSSRSASFPEIDSRKSFIKALIGMHIAGRYEVIRVLGEGGMGVVVEARHTELEQNVAIKFMFPEFLSNEVLNARFSREAKLAAKVQSPHIVRVSDVGRLPSGVPYLVMDLLSGHDLGAELDERGVLPVERAVDYILQACAGIAALHAIGVVHRDLKPSNLFVADIAGGSTLKVLDFGISKDVTTPSAALTSTETQLGTPMYMSPEQIRATKDVDTRSDVWSLGVILYELLTGTLPFERSGHSIGELFAVILMTEPIPLCMRRPELPEALERVVMRCLRRSSWDRFESVADFAEALRPFTRASSIHRIDAVGRALGTAERSSGLAHEAAPSVVTPSLPQNPRAIGAAIAMTVEEIPSRSGPKLEVDMPATRAQDVTPRRARDPLASPSLVSSSRAVPLPGETEPGARRSGIVIALGVAAAIIGAGLTFALRSSPSSAVVPGAGANGLVGAPAAAPASPSALPSVLAAGAAGAAGMQPTDVATAGGAPQGEPPPMPNASARAPDPSASGQSSPPAPNGSKRPAAQLPRTSRPPTTATGASRPATPSASDDLILDRK